MRREWHAATRQKVGSLRPQEFTVLGFHVRDIETTVDQLVQRGVKFERFEGMEQDGRRIWKAPSGARVAWFKDPTATRCR